MTINGTIQAFHRTPFSARRMKTAPRLLPHAALSMSTPDCSMPSASTVVLAVVPAFSVVEVGTAVLLVAVDVLVAVVVESVSVIVVVMIVQVVILVVVAVDEDVLVIDEDVVDVHTGHVALLVVQEKPGLELNGSKSQQ